jgi:deazaflavin-dependent oxidoreductase (nitroreductase family)
VFALPLPLYRSGHGWILGRTFVAVSHVGRTSGALHVMTAMVLRYDDATEEVVIMSAWGPDTDWMRNLRVHPAARVQLGRQEFTPSQRFLTVDEAVEVLEHFRTRHPWRVRLACRILGWPELDNDAAVRDFVSARPFVAFRPVR